MICVRRALYSVLGWCYFLFIVLSKMEVVACDHEPMLQNKGKKRKRIETQWKKNVRKVKRNSGEEAHRGRPNLQTSANFQNTLKHLVPKYPGGRQISALKHRDLMKLLPFMPDMERQFYLKLKPLSVRHECNNDNDQDIEIME